MMDVRKTYSDRSALSLTHCEKYRLAIRKGLFRKTEWAIWKDGMNLFESPRSRTCNIKITKRLQNAVALKK